MTEEFSLNVELSQDHPGIAKFSEINSALKSEFSPAQFAQLSITQLANLSVNQIACLASIHIDCLAKHAPNKLSQLIQPSLAVRWSPEQFEALSFNAVESIPSHIFCQGWHSILKSLPQTAAIVHNANSSFFDRGS